jgi:hypothetical protein
MTDYNYQNGKFADKDTLPPGDPQKVIKGSDFEPEFGAIETAVNSKPNAANPVITGTLQGGTIDGGTF